MMSRVLPFFILLFSLSLSYGQSANREKKQVAKVSKYSVTVDKNTKNVLAITPEFNSRNSAKNTFNYHYSQYLTSSREKKNYQALVAAFALDSNNSELFFEMAKYYEVTQNKSNKLIFCKKLKATKLSAPLREYAYNTLMSVEKNGILITYGEKDTYPLWILQQIEKIRPDVKVLNYDLLVDLTYRKRMQKELGLRLSKNYSRPIELLKDIALKNPSKKIYYSLTVSHLVLKQLKNNLYSTGLALKYSKTSFDNIPTLKNNWETKFLKSTIAKPKNMESDNAMHLNYVLPLIQLANYYGEQGMTQKQTEIKGLILILGKRANKFTQVQNLLNQQ